MFIRGIHKLSKTQSVIASNLFWAVLGKMTNLLSGLIVGIIVARYLGPEQYGLMNYVMSFVFLFQTFSVFGLDNIEIREESKTGSDYNKIIGTSFGIRLFTSLLCIILCISTCCYMEANVYTTELVAVYSLSIIFNSFVVARNYFYALVRNKYVVQVEIIRTLICMAIKILLLYIGASLMWFIIANVFDMLIVGMGYCVAYRNEIGKITEWRFDKKYAYYLIKESFPLMLTSAAVIVYQRIDQVMIGQIIDKESVGYFSVASRFVEILIYIPMILSQTIAPMLTRALQSSQEEYYDKGQSFMNLSVWSSLCMSVIMSLCSYWIILLLFGETYLSAVPVLQLMSFKAVSVALSYTAGAMLVVEGLQKFAILRDSFGCIVCIILNYFLLPVYGVIAAGLVTIISNIAAGYIADAFIPAYRHLFVMQTKSLLFGWRDIVLNINKLK